jgi:hypothetical protein
MTNKHQYLMELISQKHKYKSADTGAISFTYKIIPNFAITVYTKLEVMPYYSILGYTP